MSDSMQISVNGSELTIKKIPLRQYADIFRVIDNLPKLLEKFSGKSNDQILQIIPELITEALPDVVNIVNITTGMPKEDIEEMGIDDLIVVLDALYKVNNGSFIIEKLKKAVARPKTLEEPAKNPSGNSTPLNGSTV